MSCKKTHRSPLSQVTADREVFAWIDGLAGFTGDIYGIPYEPEPTFEPGPEVEPEGEAEGEAGLEALRYRYRISNCLLES